MSNVLLEVENLIALATSRPVTFSVAGGEIVCLYGLNGSGKTLLIKSICSVHKYIIGTIRKNYDDKEFGVCLQFPEHLIFNEYALTECNLITNDIELAKSILKRLGVAENQNPFTLSDGQKRLMFLYGLLATKKILIFDEPFASLDDLSKEEVIVEMERAKTEGKSIIYTANRVKDTKFADKIINLG